MYCTRGNGLQTVVPIQPPLPLHGQRHTLAGYFHLESNIEVDSPINLDAVADALICELSNK